MMYLISLKKSFEYTFFRFYVKWRSIQGVPFKNSCHCTEWFITRPDKHGHLFLVPCEKWLIQCTLRTPIQFPFYKVSCLTAHPVPDILTDIWEGLLHGLPRPEDTHPADLLHSTTTTFVLYTLKQRRHSYFIPWNKDDLRTLYPETKTTFVLYSLKQRRPSYFIPWNKDDLRTLYLKTKTTFVHTMQQSFRYRVTS